MDFSFISIQISFNIFSFACHSDDEGDLNRKKENTWWSSMVSEEQKTMMELSGKLMLLFEILRLAQSVGDKV